ncbi:MAG: helix-turn-helix domain-containing protein [Lachnospiraceae bacterium]|nr:helix-turn-helix domain-containing protein [Lachnospiraceae bacterium]
MKKDLNCPYSVIDRDIICEHKRARIDLTDIQKLHNHDGYEVVLFLSGDVRIQIESEQFQMQRGDLFFIRPLTFHGIDLTDIESYERVVVNVRYEVLREMGDAETDLASFFKSGSCSYMNHVRLTEEAIERLVRIAGDLEESLSHGCYGQKMLSRSLLAEFLITGNRYASAHHPESEDNRMPQTVSRIFSYIEEHLCEEITIAGMAEALHYSSDHLSRSFREAAGGSLKHYINAKKIALAQIYLRKNISPYEVCFMVGYNNYSSFSRRFSDQIGVSPKRFQLDMRAQR